MSEGSVERNVLSMIYHFEGSAVNIDVVNKELFSGRNKQLFEVLYEVKKEHGIISPVLVMAFLQKRDSETLQDGKKLDGKRIKATDFYPLSEKIQPKRFTHYVAFLKKQRREKKFKSILNKTLNDDTPSDQLAAGLVKQINGLFLDRDMKTWENNMTGAIDRMQYIQKYGIDMPTGFKTFDDVWGGWQKAELHVIGADSGHFKTTGTMNMVFKSLKDGHSVLWVDLEMGAKRLAAHFMCILAGVPIWRARKGLMKDEHWKKIVKVGDEIKGFKLEIVDSKSCKTLESIEEAVQRVQPDITIIDNFQIIDFPQTGDYWGPVRAAKQIKDIAINYNTAVGLLSQVTRTSKDIYAATPPSVENLWGSRALKHAADVVAIGHWPWKDYQSTGRKPKDKDLEEIKHRYNLYHSKVREDGVMTDWIYIDAELGRWRNKSDRDDSGNIPF